MNALAQPGSQHQLHREIKAAEAVKAALLNVTDDTDAIRDTLEGETSLHELVRAVLVSIEDDLTMVDGLTARLSDLRDRKQRFEDRIEAKRSLVEQAMRIAEIQTVETDVATVSTRTVAPSLALIADESAIPSEFWTPQPPKLDKKALLAALKEGRDVPGATFTNGGTTISIRRK